MSRRLSIELELSDEQEAALGDLLAQLSDPVNGFPVDLQELL